MKVIAATTLAQMALAITVDKSTVGDLTAYDGGDYDAGDYDAGDYHGDYYAGDYHGDYYAGDYDAGDYFDAGYYYHFMDQHTPEHNEGTEEFEEHNEGTEEFEEQGYPCQAESEAIDWQNGEIADDDWNCLYPPAKEVDGMFVHEDHWGEWGTPEYKDNMLAAVAKCFEHRPELGEKFAAMEICYLNEHAPEPKECAEHHDEDKLEDNGSHKGPNMDSMDMGSMDASHMGSMDGADDKATRKAEKKAKKADDKAARKAAKADDKAAKKAARKAAKAADATGNYGDATGTAAADGAGMTGTEEYMN